MTAIQHDTRCTTLAPLAGDIAQACCEVAHGAEHVRINLHAITRWAAAQTAETLRCADDPPELRFHGTPADSANLILLLSSLNFCFWSDEPWAVEFAGRSWSRTYAMYASVMRAVQRDRGWLHSRRWAEVDSTDIAELFGGEGQIPLLPQRREVMVETGQCLLDRYDGQFIHCVELAGRNARRLSLVLAEELPSFRDIPTWRDRPIPILKRAQICANDLHNQWLRIGHHGLEAMEELTVFADYRLPQYLRHVGAIELSPALQASIDALDEIPAGSEPEVELRAATIAAADLMVAALARAGLPTTACHLDKVLWERSHDAAITWPHHRTRTIYY